DVDRLVAAALELDPTNRWQRLRNVLDLERFLSFMAMEIMTCHWDGYALNRNNYRLFHDLETERMVFMPHGLDQMFGVARSSPDSPIQAPMQGMVAQALMSTTEGRQLYLERIATLRSRVFIEEKLTNRVHELSRRIRPTLAAYAPDLAEEHQEHVAYLCQRIVERARSISEQLSWPQKPVPFDADGVARLSGWRPRLSRRRGALRFDAVERDGKTVLQIKADAGGGWGAWGTRVLLEAGGYRFEGNVQTREVDNSGEICLRSSGSREGWVQARDNKWERLSYNFVVHQPLAEVELICEVRTAKGEAWFEQDSLVLTRE
ncbi:MAG: CotH kinase family protein, partial [Acidobacteriota bacterium]